MTRMFYQASVFGGTGVSTWNTAKVVTITDMFRGGTAFNADLGSWNTGSLDQLARAFEAATTFRGTGVEKWDISKTCKINVDNCFEDTFKGATSLPSCAKRLIADAWASSTFCVCGLTVECALHLGVVACIEIQL